MPVAHFDYDTAMVESALFRSTGVALDGMQYGPANDPASRSYKASGKGVGHVYQHLADHEALSQRTGPESKSRFADYTTMVGAVVEILATPAGKAALAWLDNNPNVASGLWLHGAKALPVSKPWYGYEQHGTALKKVRTVALNMRSHGDALFITSAYPDGFHAGVNATI